MSSQSADVIDLQSYRARRSPDRTSVAAKPAASIAMPTAVVAWVPVWAPFCFVPVAFFAVSLAIA